MNREPKGPDYALNIIAEMRRGTKSASARRALARGAIAVGNYTDEAKAIWAEYLEAEEAKVGA